MTTYSKTGLLTLILYIIAGLLVLFGIVQATTMWFPLRVLASAATIFGVFLGVKAIKTKDYER